MLDRVLELRYELETFLDAQGKNDLLLAMKTPDFGTQLAYLVDAFELLNSLNTKLQGRESSIITHSDHIRTFIENKANSNDIFPGSTLKELNGINKRSLQM